ncbi:MAG: 2-oxoglutarate dehydrogenase E1 component [Pseudomonadota bacterium]|nr:2-oxoglutarate dehydrogenase E1 component [Pseudomonadota bacterium]
MPAIKKMDSALLSFSSVADLQPSIQRKANFAPAAKVHPGLAAAIEGLMAAYRSNGWRMASLDPLESIARDHSWMAELDPRTYGLSPDDTISYSFDFAGSAHVLKLSELLSRLRASYCGTIALDCAHIRASDQLRWLYRHVEGINASSALAASDALRVLEQLVLAETFEHYQRATYPRHKQFSLEGSESLVPLLAAAVEEASRHGVEDIVLGMPHRGRLNVLRNVFDISAKQLFSLFCSDPAPAPAAWDLKDHYGCSIRKHTLHGDINLVLAHNPSHLESVSPVVCGMARALQDRKTDGFSRKVMPILIHGDASFSAQGVVTETLNLSQTRGYGVGGTLHLILNNQIGSTISHPGDARSTLFCADIARAIDAPIIHVNADDPDAVVAVAKLATEYRMQFGADIVVDHVGYRRHGHFGGDDPTMTQPAMQRRIRGHRSVVAIYAEKLVTRGLAGQDALKRSKAAASAAMTDGHAPGQATTMPTTVPTAISEPAVEATKPVVTAVPIGQLQAMLHRLATVPPGFSLHAGIQKMIEDWRSAAVDVTRAVDWCLGENLAYASLLANGFNIRLSGLDVGRGSFFHRYHVWHDQAAGTDWQSLHVPLRHIAEPQGFFSIFESPLSEEAVVGFEYGYTLQCGRDLVVWEAQFGDFVNNAQVIIDQYIATGEHKWGYKSGLVVLLPHGHEGGGPEHSCAYLGRFLQLCADGNLQVAMPSTASQFHHLLRRQSLMEERKPLIVMTPKTMLYGQKSSYSTLHDLARGEFLPLLGEQSEIDPAGVVRVIVTSGKIYYDLSSARAHAGLIGLPILRLEQLYPFPADALAAELLRFPRLRLVVWAQEEARNHGAWYFLREQLEAALPPGVSLEYAGRPAAAPTAICNAGLHAAEQLAVVTSALGMSAS